MPMPLRPPEAFCVRWKGFHGNILSYLECSKTGGEFVDVTLASDEGHTVEAHRLVLASCSPYFRRVLIESPCHHPVIILNGVSGMILDALVTYMYHGQVFISEDKLPTFFR